MANEQRVQRPMRFLIVEDDMDHAHVIMRTIKKERILNRVDHAIDGLQAWEMLNQEGEYADKPRPDIIILDLKMPKMNGHELLERIREHKELRRIPVVMMTTSDAERDRMQAYENNVNSYLVKPLDFQQFHQMVRDLSLYWGVWNWTIEEGDSDRD